MTLKHIFVATALAALIITPLTVPTFAANTALKTGIDVKELTKVDVNGVKIENFTGEVTIRSIAAGSPVTVSLKGTDDLLHQVLVQDNYGSDKKTLYVAFEKDAPVLKDLSTLKLTVEMPAKMPLDLTLVGGKGDVGPREANDTKVNLNGFGDIKLASAKNLKSTIDGSGEITVANANGEVAITIRGDGKYVVQKGSISHLKATIQGTGEVDIKASVKDADLKSEGAGTMHLATVTGKLSQSMSGAGTINIAKVSGSVTNQVKGSGQFDMDCAKIDLKK
jgi:hypothetical protein